jgi:uncharacterized protein DUF6311
MAASGTDGFAAPSTRGKRWSGGVMESLLRAPHSTAVLQLVSLLISSAFCWHLLPADFLTGTASFWTKPGGLVGGGISWADMTTALSGYYAFMKSPWDFPIFQVSQLGYPSGTNVIYTDSIPVVAFIGRIIYQTTGASINLYGIWTVACFVASAASLTALVSLLGARTIPAACAAAILGCTMPAMLYRWGHMSLMAHFEVILALAFYAASRKDRSPRWCLAASAPLCVLALWTHAYLFAMVTALLVAAIVQTMINRQLRAKAGLTVLAVLAAVIAATIIVSGHLSNPGSTAAQGYGFFSLNLLSPVFPQFSGILPFGIFAGILDASGGQYEGFSYFGAGILLLIFLSGPDLVQWISRTRRTDILLWLVLLGFVAFAVTPMFCLGFRCVGTIPSPGGIVLSIAESFRSSGRFVWPALYAVTAAAVVLTATRHRFGAVLLLAAALLQWMDTAPLRTAFAHSVSQPAPRILDAASWQHALAVSSAVRVFPSFSCLPPLPLTSMEIAMEVQLLATLAAVPVNSVYAARHQADCITEEATAKTSPPAGSITVYLENLPGFAGIRNAAAVDPNCQNSPRMVVCVPVTVGPNAGPLTDQAL